MSENLELVRSIYAGWERGDFSGSAEWVDPAIEFVVPDGPYAETHTGPKGLAEGFRIFLGAWADLSVEVDEYREIGEQTVLVLAHLRGRGKASGVELGELRSKQAHLLQIHAGKVAKLSVYNDRARALSDLGLEE